MVSLSADPTSGVTTRPLFSIPKSLINAFAGLLNTLGVEKPDKPQIIEALHRAFLEEKRDEEAQVQFSLAEALRDRSASNSSSREDEKARLRKFFEALFAKVRDTVMSFNSMLVSVQTPHGPRNVRILTPQAPTGSVAHLLAQSFSSSAFALPGLSSALMTRAELAAHVGSMPPRPSASAKTNKHQEDEDAYSTVVTVGGDTSESGGPGARFITPENLFTLVPALEKVAFSGELPDKDVLMLGYLSSMAKNLKGAPVYGVSHYNKVTA